MVRTPETGPAGALPPELDPRGRRRGRAGSRSTGIAPAATRGERSPRRRSRSTLGGLGLGVRIIAAALSLLVLVGSGWAWASYKKFNSQIATGSNLPAATGKDIDGKDQNILLIGNDSRAGATAAELAELSTQDDGGSINTDTMIVLHVPADGSKATLISFPRDAWVDIPGYGSNRINAAYGEAYNEAKAAGKSETDAQSAGIALTAATISQLTGLSIDHYLQINLLGFYRISVALQGVQVCLNAAQQDSYSGIDLPAGVSTIEGKQALAFVRQRHGLPAGDLDRIKRQQYFLGAVFRKVSSAGTLLNPFKLNDLLNAVSSSLLKDPGLDLISLATQVQDLQAGNITFATMVNTGDETIDGNAVLGVDPDAVKQQVAELIGTKPDNKLAGAAPTAPGSVTVTVLNGSDVNGAASQNTDRLKSAGFGVGTPGDAPSTASTVIQYPDGMQSQAKTLVAAVPGAQLALTSSVSGVTLVLGNNGVAVPDPAAATSSAAAPTTAAAPTPSTGGRSGADASCIN